MVPEVLSKDETSGNSRPRASLLTRRGFWVGVLLFLGILLIPSGLHDLPGMGHRPAFAAAVAVLMAAWWFTEALPIALTACLPILLFPIGGVFGTGSLVHDSLRATEPFVDAYIFLFLGGMMLGAAMEHVNLHRRIALLIMRAIGCDPSRLLLGMLLATAAVSLWISNTATAVMMVPIARALTLKLESQNGGRRLTHLGTALMLSVAYGSNVGGVGSKIGTGTNSIFCGTIERTLGIEISFLKFLAIGLPFVVIFLPIIWWVLARHSRADHVNTLDARGAIDLELAQMGRLSSGERRVGLVFLLAAALWILNDLIRPHVAPLVMSPWEGFRFASKHYEAGVAMLAGALVVALRTLSFRAFLGIPWGTLVLLGGSFAMASGIEASGLGLWLAERLSGVAGLPVFLQIAIASMASIGLSAIASNTATITILLRVLPGSMPVLSAATLGSSCDFMLPAGTPPNAIVFGSGMVRLPVMMRLGFLLDLSAALLITVYSSTWLTWLFA